MSIGIKQTQNLLQQQKLILTQELQLFLKLIQMTTLDLKEYLEEQLEENPVLEEEMEVKGTNGDASPYEEDYDFKTNGTDKSTQNGDNDIPHFKEFFEEAEDSISWENRISATESFLDYLKWQLSVSDFSTEDKKIASAIIGNINDDGYLESDVEEMAAHIAGWDFKHDSPETLSEEDKARLLADTVKSDKSYVENVERVLKKIQSSFDPPGVCARDLKECLLIQAEELGYSPDCTLVKIIENHLEDISRKDYKRIADTLSVPVEDVEAAALVICSLEPKPGRPFYSKDTERYIVPDFYVYKSGDELQIQPNRAFPRVRISNQYRTLISQGKSLAPEVRKYVKEKMEAAQRIMKCLEERDAVIKKVLTHIIEFQKDFFEHGRDYIKPLRLKDIAQVVGVHESTVSRITSRRYIHTQNIGVVELKSFFSRKIETSHGGEVSFERVKALMNDIIATEPEGSPYSDDDISKILQRKNIIVARRTVSKYRKLLKIPSSSERQRK